MTQAAQPSRSVARRVERTPDAQLAMFEEVADWAATLPNDDRLYVDAVRGHIRLGNVVFADLGSHLHLWTYVGHQLTPAVARELGQALVAWADKKDGSHAHG